MDTGGSFAVVYGALGITGCMGFLLALYNLVALIGVMREKTDEPASGLSKIAWGLGFFSLFLGPCGWFTACVTLIMANIERRRMYQEKSPLSSATPVRMASINGGLVVFMGIVMTIATLITILT